MAKIINISDARKASLMGSGHSDAQGIAAFRSLCEASIAGAAANLHAAFGLSVALKTLSTVADALQKEAKGL